MMLMAIGPPCHPAPTWQRPHRVAQKKRTVDTNLIRFANSARHRRDNARDVSRGWFIEIASLACRIKDSNEFRYGRCPLASNLLEKRPSKLMTVRFPSPALSFLALPGHQ
jgi:hypothetical protein